MSPELREAGPEYLAEAITIADLLLRNVPERPDQEALVLAGLRFTYSELLEAAIEKARSLAALGVERGQHVGILMPNCADLITSFIGITMLGAVAVPLNTRFRTRELSYAIQQADLTVLLTTDILDEHVDYVARLHETYPDLETADRLALDLADAPVLRSIVLLGRGGSPGLVGRAEFEGLAAAIPAEEIDRRRMAVRVRDSALMLFTSGTTAYPKGCLLSHEALVRVWGAVADRLGFRPAERVFDPLPLFHLGGIGPLLGAIGSGATFVSMCRFEPGEGLDLIEKERTSWLYTMFPPVTMGLIRHESFSGRDLSHVRAIMNVAPSETLRIIDEAFPDARCASGPFGMTEAGGAITCNRISDDADLLETSGPPLPGVEVRVVDPESGEDLETGATGELLVRTYGMLDGYYGMPEETARTVDPEGWLHSGDLGVRDERGWVSYVGRLKEMIKVGGENVAPQEIESHLSTHPAVKLAVVVAVPDDRLDEVPAAFVEVAPGYELSETEVIEHCTGAIASFKVPRHVRMVTDWPMSATKVQRSKLVELVTGASSGR